MSSVNTALPPPHGFHSQQHSPSTLCISSQILYRQKRTHVEKYPHSQLGRTVGPLMDNIFKMTSNTVQSHADRAKQARIKFPYLTLACACVFDKTPPEKCHP